MKVLIVDDEPLARERLRHLLREIGPPYEVAGEAGSGEEALAMTAHLEADLVLMDIRMPGIDGLQAAAQLAEREPPPAVIFTTAYDEHALQAFEGNAVDYLLKPVRRERLQKALERAHALTRVQLQALQSAQEAPEEYICAPFRGGVRRIPLDEIIYFQADQKYVCAHHTGGETLLEDSLKSLEEQYGDRFLRIHRNALVARSHLIGLEKSTDGESLARLKGTDKRLAISRRHLSIVRQWLKEG